MKLAPCLLVMCVLVFAGCADEGEQVPAAEPVEHADEQPITIEPEVVRQEPEFDPYATTGRGAAEGLADAERGTLATWLSGTQEVRQVVSWTERSNTRAAQAWRELTHQKRVDYLRQQTRQGSGRAARALKAVLSGSVTEEQLEGMGDLFVAPSATWRSDGVEPMPFGDSMHGPWNIGPTQARE